MRVVIPIESRFKMREGRAVSHHLTYDRFWKRYLSVFDSVVVLGRLFPEEDPAGAPVEGEGVEFVSLPPYSGAMGYLRHAAAVRAIIQKLCDVDQAYILRVPGIVGTALAKELRRRKLPFGVEVVANPSDVFAPETFRNPLRPIFRWIGCAQLRSQCREAVSAAYVTQYELQRMFPPARDAHTTHYSSVELPSSAFAKSVRDCFATDGVVTLLSIGTMEQMYKGFDVLIEATRICTAQGLNLRLRLLGDGKYRAKLEEQVRSCGLESHVSFLGQIPAGPPVQALLDAVDIFVLASRTEGLPRAMIEAMARGLPCLGTQVGGIPELLTPDDLVPPDDPAALAIKLQEVALNTERRRAMSDRNLITARNYHNDILMSRRVEHYRYVRKVTEQALASHFGRSIAESMST